MRNRKALKGLAQNDRSPFHDLPLEGVLSKFERHLRANNYSPQTIKTYLFDLAHLTAWLKDSKGIESFADLTGGHIREYQVALASQPGRSGKIIAGSTRTHVVAAVVTLAKYLFQEGIVRKNPAEGISNPRVYRKIPDNLLSEKQMERLLSVPRLDHPVELRNRALMELLYATGIRQAEALDLRTEDVDLATGEVRVKRGKGGRGRIVPLCRESAAVLAAYLSQARPALIRGPDPGFFFMTRRGKRVSGSGLSKAFRRYAAAAGIRRPVGFHTFRHSVATHLMNRKVGLRYIQELLGHQSIASTQIYTKVSIGDLKAAHARYHPREKMNV